ncbi:hypothetical protein [Lactobacillus selangorensis]
MIRCLGVICILVGIIHICFGLDIDLVASQFSR